MDKPTPGPWHVDSKYLSEVQTTANRTVASCWHKHAENEEIRIQGVLLCSLEESAANARLIAAAPDLLEACENARLQLEYLDEKYGTATTPAVLLRLEAAINKARSA